MRVKTLLFLDDLRNPLSDEYRKYLDMSPITLQENTNIEWVTNYDEFVKWIERNGLPDALMLDHDLEPQQYTPEEYWSDYFASMVYQNKLIKETDYGKCGVDCCRYLVDYINKNNLNLPPYYIHSQNPVGRDKMDIILKAHLVERYLN